MCMERRDNILEELRQVSVVVAGISRNLPYHVPAGYFEGFAEKLQARIMAEKSATEEAGTEKIGSAGDALLSRQIDDPLEELAALSPLISRLDKKTPFSTPGTYFGELTGNVLEGVQAIEFVNDELENLSPLMEDLKYKNVYQAPEGYFDALAGILLTKVKEAPVHARVISIGRKRSWLKYSAAAAVVGLIVIAGWLGFHHSAKYNDDIKNLASKVSDQEILNYLDNLIIPLPESVTNSTATLELNDSAVKDMLADVSDDELTNYLEQRANTKEPAIN